jgi:predicted Zn-ribbon and HTH transcriptional regulator
VLVPERPHGVPAALSSLFLQQESDPLKLGFPLKGKEYPDHAQTVRQQMTALLQERDMTARELSQALRIREKEVYEHLSHVARSALARKTKLTVLPFQCLACGYVFTERRRFTRPSRCPRCKKSHLEMPTYRIAES